LQEFNELHEFLSELLIRLVTHFEFAQETVRFIDIAVMHGGRGGCVIVWRKVKLLGLVPLFI